MRLVGKVIPYCGEFEELKATLVHVITHSFSTDDMKMMNGCRSTLAFTPVFQAFYQFLLPASENVNCYCSVSVQVVKRD